MTAEMNISDNTEAVFFINKNMYLKVIQKAQNLTLEHR